MNECRKEFLIAQGSFQKGKTIMYIANPDRYKKMEYRRCGKSGLLLPVISLGLWQNFGDHSSYENMRKMILTAFDHGITHFDLANNYGPENGAAEKNFGRILKEDLMPYRDELIISTKAGYEMWDGPYGNWGSRKYLLASLDQSLKRMGLEYVDIFYHHRMDPDTPLEETMGALAQAVRSGKALYIGLSNYDGPTLEKACAILERMEVPFVIDQNRYSILDRTIEANGLQAMNNQLEKGLITFSPLAKGQLTDRYLNGIPADSRIRTDGRFLHESDLPSAKVEQLRKLNDLAAKRGEDLSVMALRWILDKPGTTSVLIGASKPEQILKNLQVLDSRPLSKLDLEEIDRIARKIHEIEEANA
ncbi:aldo/keto reductase [Erysipelotrichaceae bacterium 51-3]